MSVARGAAVPYQADKQSGNIDSFYNLVNYAYWEKVICLEIHSIPHPFWPIAKAGTQINEKKTLVTTLASGQKQIRLIRQQVKFPLQAPIQINNYLGRYIYCQSHQRL